MNPNPYVFELLISGACVVLWWFFTEKMKAMQKQIDENAVTITRIQTNYLDRFADLKEHITSGYEHVKDAIADLREDLARNYVTKDDCADYFSKNHDKK